MQRTCKGRCDIMKTQQREKPKTNVFKENDTMKNLTTNTTTERTITTNNTTTAAKEGKTMKNTKNIRTKIIAAALAAITTVSAMAVSASADNTQKYPGPTDIEIAVPENTMIEDLSGMNPYVAPVPADELSETSIPASEAQPAADSELIDEIGKKLEVSETEVPAEDDEPVLTAAPGKADYKLEDGASEASGETEENTAEGEEESEEAKIAKKLVGAIADAGLDMLGDAIPGGKLFAEPLKAIFGDVFGEEDGTAAAINRLAEDSKKQYEDLKNRINNINDNINTYTKYLENETKNENDKGSLGQMFRNLSANLNDLSSEIKGIMSNPDTTPEEKLVLLANVNNGKDNKNYLADVRLWADQISTTINKTICKNGETAIDMNLYDALSNMAAKNYMFAGEAHEEALKSAKILTEQYMYANALLLQCQNAYKSLEGLTPEQVEVLKQNPDIYEKYKKCTVFEDQSFQSDKQQESINRVMDCIAGFQKFTDKKAEGNRYIKNGTVEETVIDFVSENFDYITGGNLQKMYNAQYLKGQSLDEFAAYARNNGMSIKQLLDKNDQEIAQVVDYSKGQGVWTSTGTGEPHCYIVYDPTITTNQKARPSSSIYGCSNTYLDCNETIKVIDIYDPECRVQEIVVRTYVKENTYSGNTFISEVKDNPHDFLTIGSHKATEKDNIRYFTTTNTDPTKGPTISGKFKGPGKIIIKVSGPKGGPNIKVPGPSEK